MIGFADFFNKCEGMSRWNDAKGPMYQSKCNQQRYLSNKALSGQNFGVVPLKTPWKEELKLLYRGCYAMRELLVVMTAIYRTQNILPF